YLPASLLKCQVSGDQPWTLVCRGTGYFQLVKVCAAGQWPPVVTVPLKALRRRIVIVVLHFKDLVPPPAENRDAIPFGQMEYAHELVVSIAVRCDGIVHNRGSGFRLFHVNGNHI